MEPINDTNITRCVATVGLNFKFPMNVEISVTPSLNKSANTILCQYLRGLSNDSKLATSVV